MKHTPYHDLNKLPHLTSAEVKPGGKTHQTKEQDGRFWALIESEDNDPSLYWLEIDQATHEAAH